MWTEEAKQVETSGIKGGPDNEFLGVHFYLLYIPIWMPEQTEIKKTNKKAQGKTAPSSQQKSYKMRSEDTAFSDDYLDLTPKAKATKQK